MTEFHPDTYRDAELVGRLEASIRELADRLERPVRIMHICGTHEHEIGRFGLRDLLPDNVQVLAGPGCPVCVCDAAWIDRAVRLAQVPGVTVLSYGDMLAVPGGIPVPGERRGDVRMSLLDARAGGGDVQAVYSVFDAARLAREQPRREMVFFSVGFETTVVAVAALLLRGAPENLSILEANYYTVPATHLLPTLPGFDVQGFLLPGHAAAVTGYRVYDHLPQQGIACAVAGFEPVDVLAGIAAVLRQLLEGAPRIDNTYGRVVHEHGNERALRELDQVFELGPRRWRGVGEIAASGYRLRPPFRHRAVEERLGDRMPESAEPVGPEHPKGCRCADVTLGLAMPTECPVFGRLCSPDNPYGPCMVSHEGTCRAWALYGMGRERIHVLA